MADIFISYKSERRPVAEHLADILDDHGYSVWFDYALSTGRDFARQIETELHAAHIVLVLWCDLSVDSDWVRSEARYAKANGKLLPCLIAPCTLPVEFNGDQARNLTTWSGEPSALQPRVLLDDVAARLDRPPVPNLPALDRAQRMWRRLGATSLWQLTLGDAVADRDERPAPDFGVKPPIRVAPPPAPNKPVAEPATRPAAGASPLPDKNEAPSTPSGRVWAGLNRDDPDILLNFELTFAGTPEADRAKSQRAILRANALRERSAALADWDRWLEEFKACDHARMIEADLAGLALTAARATGDPSMFDEVIDRFPGTEEKFHALQEREAAERAWPVLAAKAGEPVAERLFPVRLSGVANWPAPNMVAIPPGRFLMGAAKGEVDAADHEFPQHQVDIDYAFALGQHAVTFAEWDAARAAGAKLAKPEDEGWGRERRPVINVSWDDAMAYLAWMNERLGLLDRPDAYRLPSEAEWEYACRAGTTTPFSFGSTISTSQANYDGDYTYGSGAKGEYRERTTPVGSFSANAFGLYDMHGNVWEWTQDYWNESHGGAPDNGSARTSGYTSRRVLRGGSWFNNPQYLRSASRSNRSIPSKRNYNLGFRVARTL